MKPERPRLLFIAPVMPAAGGNGLAMRQGQFLGAYQPDFAIDLAVIPVAGAANSDDRFARSLVRDIAVFPPNGIDTHFSLLARLKNAEDRLAAFAAYGRPSITARLTPAIQNDIAAWAARRPYQLMHVGRLYMLTVAPPLPVPCLVDADENDARLFQKLALLATHQRDFLAARWAQSEADHSTQITAKQLSRAAHIFTACQADAVSLEQPPCPVSVVPNVISRPHLKPQRKHSRVLFVGTLGYRPNEQGLVWFIKNCWPRLRKTKPHLRFDIVGAGASAALRRLTQQPGINMLGWQKNLAPFYLRTNAVIVPIQAGGGSRIKLLEAASFGCIIVTTAAGAEGAGMKPNRDYLRADGPAQFTRAVQKALRGPLHFGLAARCAIERGHEPGRWQAHIRAIARRVTV